MKISAFLLASLLIFNLALAIDCGDTITQSTDLDKDLVCNGDGIIINANDVIFNCDGHSIKGSGSGTGVLVKDFSEISVSDCTISNFDVGIQQGISSGSDGNSISYNEVSDCYTGIKILHSSTSVVMKNDVNGNSMYGIFVDSSNSNQFYENNVKNNDGAGIYVSGSSNNYFYDNYLDNPVDAFDDGNDDWSIPAKNKDNIVDGPKVGGNYWSDFGTNSTGCFDKNYDGFCDKSKDVSGGSNVDNLPLKKDWVAAPQQNTTRNVTSNGSGGGGGGSGGGGGGSGFGGSGDSFSGEGNHSGSANASASADSSAKNGSNSDNRLSEEKSDEVTKNDFIIYFVIVFFVAFVFIAYMLNKSRKR